MSLDICSEVEDKFLYLIPPIITKEAQCLMNLFGFWKQHALHLKILFWPICQVTRKASIFKWDLEHKNNSATSLDCGANCPVAWATWPADWIVLGRSLVGKSAMWRTSLVAQWLRICLPMQGTWVWALVREDPTSRGATKPMHHNYWACALEPASHNYWARVLQLLKPACLAPVLHNKRSHRNEKPAHHNEE